MADGEKLIMDEAFWGLAKKLAPRTQKGYLIDGKKTDHVRYAHKQVVAVAKGIAHELYESMMSNNIAFATWKKFCGDLKIEEAEAEFVRFATPWLLDDARANLAALLRQPGREHLKDAIHDVLVKDNSIKGANPVRPLAPILKEAFRHGR